MATNKQRDTDDDKSGGLTSELPIDRLLEAVSGFGQALGERGVAKIGDGIESISNKFGDLGEGNGSVKSKAVAGMAKGASPVKAGAEAVASKVKDSVGGAVENVGDGIGSAVGGLTGGNGGKKSDDGGGKKIKVTNIVESVDVPVPREVAYEQWTQFEEFPSFMKKVENVTQEDDDTLTWQAQIFWSHRTWKAKIIDQVPNERIVWKSQAEKGKVDGAVTFHELAPDLTRVLVTLEYHPKGFFEHTANMWRAQGRRVRVELKHFRRYVATQTLLSQDDVDGWPGEIHDGKVVSKGVSKGGGGKQSSKSSGGGSTKASSSGGGRKSASSSTKSSSAKKSTGSSTSNSGSSAKKSTAKKSSSSSSNGGSARKSTAKKSTAKKSTAKKTPAKKTSSARSSGGGSATRKRAAAKTASSRRSSSSR